MNKKLLFSKDKILLAILATAVFIWFYQISKLSPLAGDDWAFHNNSMTDGIVDSALGMYQGWEGRLMTLFSIHYFILNRGVWEVFNAMMYAAIFLFGALIIKPKDKLLYAFGFFVVILTIKDNIRMEVFSWTTGSVYYGIPLFLSIIYTSIQYWILNNPNWRKPWYIWVIALGAAFYLPLGMENIGIASIGLNVFMIVLIWIRKRKIDLFQISIFLFFVSAYIIWALSPGSSIRLSQMPEWQMLSIFDKITRTLPNVLYYTFVQNKYLNLFLSATLIVYNLQKGKGLLRWIYNPVLIIAMGMTFIQRLALFVPDLTFIQSMADGNSLITLGFWLIFALVLISNIIHIDYQNAKIALIPLLLMAVLSSASLIMSPVIGYRLMVYSVFFLMLITLYIFDKIEIKRLYSSIILVIFTALIFQNANIIYRKYQSVNLVTQERLAILADYKVYYEQYKDGIWLPRYPIYTIHGGDIEIEDQYHMRAFKTYFDLPQDEKLTFYWKESY